ncbi:MAG TPA: hypothetical protein VN132_15095 [Bdellovibrio sp.]|nr:hypothetical protein [Bdellovibrio sp.]
MRKSILLLILLSSPSISWSQVQTHAECVATVRGRASLSISKDTAEKLCSENPIDVVNCALTQMQSARLTANLEKSIHQCRLEWTATSENGRGLF